MTVTNVLYWVKNLDASVEFYETIGFTIKTHIPNVAEMQLGNFLVTLVPIEGAEEEFQSDVQAELKGAGAYLYIEVDDVDAKHADLTKKGIISINQPRDWPWGNREFLARDPDGYKTVFWRTLSK